MVEIFTLDFYRWRRLSNGQAFQTDQEANVCGRDIGQEDDEVDDGDVMYKYTYIYIYTVSTSSFHRFHDEDVIKMQTWFSQICWKHDHMRSGVDLESTWDFTTFPSKRSRSIRMCIQVESFKNVTDPFILVALE